MKTRVLFLDDEQSLLNGIQRRLGFDYDMTCCTSGEEALGVMREMGPFAVVVTDMRMPQMNGIQFIRQARTIAPDSVYVMLTGNQDQATVIQAMNEGQVFRFLNKPCDHEALRRAVDSALRQYRLITSEKELLEKTFTGAIGVMTEVLEMSQPAIYSQAAHVEDLVCQLATALECSDRWEYTLAAKLNSVGQTFLSDRDRAKLAICSPTDKDAQELYKKSTATSCRLIEKIPRLHVVAQVIAAQWDVDGSIELAKKEYTDQLIRVGATLLRTATLWNSLLNEGHSPEAALELLGQELPALDSSIVAVLKNLDSTDIQANVVERELDDLCAGDILAQDVLAVDGSKLLSTGRRLSWATIEKLRLNQEPTLGKAIRVVPNATMLEPALS